MTSIYGILSKKIDQHLSAIPDTEKNVARFFSILAAVLIIGIVSVELSKVFFRPSYPDSSDGRVSVLFDFSFVFRKLRIGLALVINLIDIWPFKMKRYFISTLSLVWAVIEYALWFKYSLFLKANGEALGLSGLPEPNTLGFYPATLWDALALVLVIALFIWNMKLYLSILIPPGKSQNGKLGHLQTPR